MKLIPRDLRQLCNTEYMLDAGFQGLLFTGLWQCRGTLLDASIDGIVDDSVAIERRCFLLPALSRTKSFPLTRRHCFR